MFKAVLFDFDGTLHDRDSTVKDFIMCQYVRFPELQQADPDLWVDRFVTLDDHGYVWKDKVYAQLLGEFGISDIQAEVLLEDYVNGISSHCVGMAGLTGTLTRLKGAGLKLGLVTNGKTDVQMSNIVSLGIDGLFDDIAISGREGVSKPDPAIFGRALRRLHVEPGEAIYVGDHPENDVEASQRAGMQAVWLRNTHFPLGSGKPFGVIDGLEELPRIVGL